ncbi:arsenite methyltransferase [Amycolatopsis sp. NPDC051071]|uniref:arsenite methyltransferase n=1 Tax=Amycolatopsis sp. NPDC051071 TaxID=3154637 RepID=UPI00342AC373
MSHTPDLKTAIRARYGSRANLMVEPAAAASCCEGPSSCCGDVVGGSNNFSSGLYDLSELDGVPLQAQLATLGCGNPTALSELHAGETVLDLGSGGGLDVILSARRVGPTGHAYGMDMTDEMLELAWRNAAEAKIDNVTFLKGDVESVPAPDASFDVVISNCVINLAVDKSAVFAEIYRVLRPGGRLAVADVVIDGGLDDVGFADQLRRDQHAWGSCIAGALSDREYRDHLRQAGFDDIGVEIHRRHTTEELFAAGIPDWATDLPRPEFDRAMDRFTSSFVRAVKPA